MEEDRCSSQLESELKEALEWKSSAEIEFKKAADAGKLLLDRIEVLQKENEAIKQQEKNYEVLSTQMIMRDSAPRLTVTRAGGRRASIEQYAFEQHRRQSLIGEPFEQHRRLSAVGGSKDFEDSRLRSGSRSSYFEDETPSEDASPKPQPCRTRGLTKDFEELLLENDALQETNRMLQEQLNVKRDSMAEPSDLAFEAAPAQARPQDTESSSDSEQEDSGDDAEGDGQNHADRHARDDHGCGDDIHLLVRHLRQQLDKARESETQIREEMKLRLATKAREMNMVKAESTNLKMMCISETLEIKNVQRLYEESNFRVTELQLRITQLQEKLSSRQLRRNSTVTSPQFPLEEAGPSAEEHVSLGPRISLANEFAEVDVEITNDEVDELVSEVSSLKEELATAEEELHRVRKELVDTRTRRHQQDGPGLENSGLEGSGPENSECRALRLELKEAQDRQADLRMRCQVLQDERRDAVARRGVQWEQSAQPADGLGEPGPGAELPQSQEEALASDPTAALATMQAAHGEELAAQRCLLQDEHREELVVYKERARQHPSSEVEVTTDESASEARLQQLQAVHGEELAAQKCLLQDEHREELAMHEERVRQRSPTEVSPDESASEAALATLQAAHGEELAAQKCLLQDEHREELAAHEEQAGQHSPPDVSPDTSASEARLQQLQAAHAEELAAQKRLLQDEHREELAVHEEQARQRPPSEVSPDERASEARLQELQAALATLQAEHREELAAQKCLLQDDHREKLDSHGERTRQRPPSEVSPDESSEARLQQLQAALATLQAAHGEELAAQRCSLQDEHREELAVHEERARQRPPSEVSSDEPAPEARLQELQELNDKHQDALVVQRDQLLEEHRASEVELRQRMLGERTGALAAQKASLIDEHRASLYVQVSALQGRHKEDVAGLASQQEEQLQQLQDQHKADKAELLARWVQHTESLEAREAQLKEELTRHREDLLERQRTRSSFDSTGESRLEARLQQLQDQHRAELAAQKARLQEEHKESLIEHRERWESAAHGDPDFPKVDSPLLLLQDDQGLPLDRQQEMQNFWAAQQGADEPRQSDWWGNVCALLTCTRAPPCVRSSYKRKFDIPPPAPPGG